MPNAITVSTIVDAPIERVWASWNQPEHITKWAFASDDWEAPEAENDLRVGGTFRTVMSAKDKSASFDFTGTYTEVKERSLIAYEMSDGRNVRVAFEEVPNGVQVTETFDPESENSEEKQQAGWQAILENFRQHTESNA